MPTDDVATVNAGAPLVAVTWATGQSPADHSTISIRGRGPSGWTDWKDVEVAATLTDPAALRAGRQQRVGTDPVWLGDVTQVQVRYPSANAGAMTRGRVEFIDPGVSPADSPVAAPASSAAATAARPTIISRAAWGADESMRGCGPAYSTTTAGAVLHHTVDSNSYTPAQAMAMVRGIYAYHTKSLGWCDIGYNALVDKYGQIFEGRYGGLDRPVIGAHALGFNVNTFGVSVLGTYSTVKPSTAALNSIENLMAWRIGSFYRYALGTTVLTSNDSGSRYKAGTKVTLPFITGHRDTYATECPGNALYPYLSQIRQAVAQRANYYGSPIFKRWAALGGGKSPWGLVNRAETPTTWGLRTIFDRGLAVASSRSGVFAVGGGIDATYTRLNGITTMGAPVRDEYAITNGARADFWSATITWNAAAGAHALRGGLRNYWLSLDAEKGPLGFATSEEMATSGGARQDFQQAVAWWSSSTGTHRTAGGISAKYQSLGGPSSALRFPTGDATPTATGAGQDFQGGRIDWDRATGAFTVTYTP